MRELREANKSHIIIYDLGRGTFEASFSSIGHGVFEVLANPGGTHLRIIDSVVKQ